jgi:hypothetical protein
MLQTILFERLQQAEALRYLEQFARVLRAAGSLSTALDATLDDLEARLREAHTAFRQATASAQTARLQALEEERDTLLSGLGKVCDGYRDCPDEPLRNAASLLHANLKLYGGAYGITRQNVKSETTSIDAVLRDWRDKPALAAAVRSLHLDAWAARLQQVNSEYDSLSIARIQERAAADNAVAYTVKDKLTEARPLYEEIATLLNGGYAMVRRGGQNAEAWLGAIGASNATTEEFAALLAGRATRRAASSAAEAAATPEEGVL